MANYAFTTGKSLPTAENGHTFTECNFMQREPHTAIFAGVTGLTFIRCNLCNCDVPADATLISCNRAQIDWCSNLNPKFLEHGLATCAVNCSHVVSTDVIQVAGVTVETVYHYNNAVVA